MNYNFTDGIRKTLTGARDAALKLKHDYVGTEHLLMGLIAQDDTSVGRRVLLNTRIPLDLIQARILEHVRPGRAPASMEIPYTTQAKKVLEYALDESREMQHPATGSAHLLLGMLREERGIAAQVLKEFEIDIGKIKQDIKALYQSEPLLFAEQLRDTNRTAFEEVLHKFVQNTDLLRTDIAVVANLESAPPGVVAEIMASLDALHRAWGGSGLAIEGEFTGAATPTEEYV